jgi:oligopeptide transport system substrate-binding protein
METTYSFGYWVRRQRKALDLTQAALAQKVGCATITIRKIEADERRPSRQMAGRLADCLAINEPERSLFIESALGLAPTDTLSLPQSPLPATVATTTSLTPDSGSRRTLRFAGRQEELAWLNNHLQQALDGDGRVAFISGEAGRGKTALLEAFARQVRSELPEGLVLSGRCTAYAGTGDPYLPFRDLFHSLMAEVGHRDQDGTLGSMVIETLLSLGPGLVGSLLSANALWSAANSLPLLERHRLRRLAEQQGSHPPGTEREQLFSQVSAVLSALSQRYPLLLLIDDVQWIDASSASLLFHLGHRLHNNRILIVAAYRPSEVQQPPDKPGSHGSQHPLSGLLQEMRRRFGDIVLDLGQFDPVRNRRFMDSLLDMWPNRLPDEFRTTLFWRTRGHPLFTLELVKEMQQRGDLVLDSDEQWVEGPSLAWDTIPARVEAVIASQLDRLDETSRAILQAASVEGEFFTVELLAPLLDLEKRELLQSLSSNLEGRYGLVREAGERRAGDRFLTRYQFRHILFQRYLYESMSRAEQRIRHADLAQLLHALHTESGEFLVDVAHHYSEAGSAAEAIPFLLQAGDRARTLYAHREAAAFYWRAIHFLQEQQNDEDAAQAYMKLGLTYHLDYDFERARQAYDQGFRLWRRLEASPQPPVTTPAPHPLRLTWNMPGTLDPTMGGFSLEAPIVTQLFSGLIGLSAEGEVVPDVARRWEIVDDGHTYIFHLRDDVVWSDGTPLTASDFVFTYRRALDPQTAAPVAGLLLYAVKGARALYQGQNEDPSSLGVFAPDDHTLVIELQEPASYFLQALTYYVLLPVPRHAVQRHGADWAEPQLLVNNGPFCVQRYEPGQRLLLQRNPRYHGRWAGNLSEVSLTLEVDAPSQFAMYQNDELDVVYNWFFSTKEMTGPIRQYPSEYQARPCFSTVYLAVNPQHPPFDDRRVRRAFAMALDKDTLVHQLYGSHELAANGGFIPPGMPGHLDDVDTSFDLQRARTLLAQAGYSAREPQPTAAILAYPSREDTASYLAQQWQQMLGVTVDVNIREPAAFMNDLLNGKLYPFVLGGWWADYPDPENFLRVCVKMDVPMWHDPRYEGLLEEALLSDDQEHRVELYRQADRILTEEAVIIPLTYSPTHLLQKPWVSNFVTVAVKHPGFWKDVIIEPH